jgi:uncharacterized protein (TIGR00290 family)
MRRVALSWSGGKDSALALRALREELRIEPEALITTITADYGRVTMHGVRRRLVRAQARAVGLPLVEVEIPARCPNDVYEAMMRQALGAPPLACADTIAFADLFLADIRAYREERLRAAGREGLFPLWGRDTRELAEAFIRAGFKATLVCVDLAYLDAAFLGRRFDESLLSDLPARVDPCGENGEFHTFVHDGPIFGHPVQVENGEAVIRDGYGFQELVGICGGRPAGRADQAIAQGRAGASGHPSTVGTSVRSPRSVTGP